MSEISDFRDRLPYEGEPHELLTNIVHDYGFDNVNHYEIVTAGFEDCNFVVDTDKGKLFVKCYAKIRTPEDIDRSVQILEAVSGSGINHPHLYRTIGNALLTTQGQVQAVVMDYIDGESFHTLGRSPTDEEASLVLGEAAKINKLDINPPFIYDSIAIVNILDMYKRVQPYMTEDDLALVKPVVEGFEHIGVNELPKVFVHGDLISTNVILDKTGRVWVIDFSVANRYPRVQELAVISSSLMYGNGLSLREITEKAAAMYEAVGGTLTDREKEALFPMARAAQAMELMGGYQYIYINKDNVEEAEHWQKVGREGLQKELA